jgi:hypothetical protein
VGSGAALINDRFPTISGWIGLRVSERRQLI